MFCEHQMKSLLLISLVSLVFTLILFEGCSKSPSPKLVSSSTPTKEQLEKSNFVKFASELNLLPEDQRRNYLQSFLISYSNSPIIEDSSLAIFYWHGKAKSVLINGDIQLGWTDPDTMNQITCGYEDFFYKIYSLPADARVDYQLIVDDSTITDPRNPVVTPSGFGLHSQCAMPLFEAKTIREYRNNFQYGTIDTLLFKTNKTLMSPRMLKVYKPANYDSIFSLPTLYVNDGFKAIEYNSYINVLDNLIADNKIKPVLVVFIDFIEGDQNLFLNKTDEYFKSVCDELVPLIDANYKTSQLAKDRVLAGISAGGHISLLTALKRSDVFLNAAGQSSTMTEELFETIKNISKTNSNKKGLKMYFDVGRYDLVNGTINNYSFLYANQLLDKEIKKAGIDHTFRIFNDGHQWANWRERIDEILIYFFGI
jgi:enterochelin esterase family protein